MSGYGRGDSRGDSRGGGRRDFSRASRDHRERSPNRQGDRGRGGYGRRDDRVRGGSPERGRGAGDRFDGGGYRRGGGRDGGGGGRGGGGRGGYRGGGAHYDSSAPAPVIKAPPVPSNVPIPSTGTALNLSRFKSKSTAQRTTVLTNHFRIQSLPKCQIYEYDVRFEIPPTSHRPGGKNEVNFELKKKVLETCADQLQFGAPFVFDGVSLAWSTEMILQGRDQGTKRVWLPNHSEERPNEIDVTVRGLGIVEIAALTDAFRGGRQIDTLQQMVWLNALFRDDPSRRYLTKPRGLQYYSREDGLYRPLESTKGVLEALLGFHQSISSHFGVLSVNVDTSCTAFYTPHMPMLHAVKAFIQDGDINRPNTVDWDAVEDSVKGMLIYVTHRGDVGMSKRTRIQRLYKQIATEATFTIQVPETGQIAEITVAQYFATKYGITLQYPNLPLFETRLGLLPIEICRTAAGERYKEVLEGKQTADFIKFATSPARIRATQIMESVGRLAWHGQAKLAAHGVSVETKMLEVDASRLPLPAPVYARNATAEIRNGGWNLQNKVFTKPEGFRRWGHLYFEPAGFQGAPSPAEFEAFMRAMWDACRLYGIGVPVGAPAVLRGNPNGSIRDALAQLVDKVKQKQGPDGHMLLFCFIHDGARADLYKAIKTITEVDLGVACQVLKVEKSIRGRGGAAQYCANVAMKINLKIGGGNAEVREPWLDEAPTMMIGGDVNHPAPSQLRSAQPPPSFMALTGSKDRFASRYSAIAASTPATAELMTGIDMPNGFPTMVEQLVKRFTTSCGFAPKRVVYWRDGVSESQEATLMNTEVKAMQKKFRDMKLNMKLTVILAVKRHHTRFFPTKPHEGDPKLGNVLPGTVVESGNGSAFVIGHGALQGTVRPTHYKILHDDNKLSADQFHRLILHGCYSYGKATRGVHTHAAIYYADQVAERSRARLRVQQDGGLTFKDVHPDLRETSMWWQ